MSKALKGKMKGKTKAQRLALFKKAAKSWKGGNRKKAVKRGVTRVRKAYEGRKATVAARKATRRRKAPVRRARAKTQVRKVGRSGFNQQKLFKLARMAALLGPHAGVWMGAGTPQDKVAASVGLLSGYDINTGTFSMEKLAAGYIPLLATTAVTKVIPKISGLIGGLM